MPNYSGLLHLVDILQQSVVFDASEGAIRCKLVVVQRKQNRTNASPSQASQASAVKLPHQLWLLWRDLGEGFVVPKGLRLRYDQDGVPGVLRLDGTGSSCAELCRDIRQRIKDGLFLSQCDETDLTYALQKTFHVGTL